MSRRPFDPAFAALPPTIPVFPLPGVLLLPDGRLPLNVFEPRYLNMVQDALAGDRIIGMIQPQGEERPDGPPPALWRTGCAGRIVAFSETDDGRYLITLAGLCRFRVGDEVPTVRGYRRVIANWASFAGDMEDGPAPTLDRTRLIQAIEAYFKAEGLSADWDTIKNTPDDRLVVALSMVCPFGPSEKQALLEAQDATRRGETLIALMEMAAVTPPSADDSSTQRH